MMKIFRADFSVSSSVIEAVYARQQDGDQQVRDWTDDVLKKLEERVAELASELGLKVETK